VKICIDTNAYSSLKRGNNNVLQILENSSKIIVPTIVIGELFAGFNIGSKYNENSIELQMFLKKYGVELNAPDCSIAECYGRIISDLRHKGTPIPTNDIWIAATSIETGSRLLSNDNHFTKITGLLLYSF
jgi:tRNA(fMet)-specific endonuclease VapC